MQWLSLLLLNCLSVLLDFASSGSPPSLVVEPVDTVAGYDGPPGLILSGTLQCQGRPDDSVISWYKDNQPIENAGIPSVNVSNGWLTVGTTHSGEDVMVLEGYYYCTVMSSFGTVTSHTAWIKVQKLKSFAFLWDTSSLTRIENAVAVQSVYMELPPPSGTLDLWSVTCGTSTVTCSSLDCPFWHSFSLSGQLLVQSVICVRYSDIQKVIPECDANSSVAIASFGQDPMSRMKHDFNFGGRDVLPMKGRLPFVSVKAGESAILYCISNDPNSTYSWNHNGFPVDVDFDSRYSFITDGTLEIRTAVEEDSGLYECSYTFPNIERDVGTRKTSMNLTVYSLPITSLTLMESDSTRTNIMSCNADNSFTTNCFLMHSNSSVTLHCSAGGSTPLAVKLVNNGIQLHHENDSVSLTHTIDNPSSGIYQCIATNKYGSQQTSMFLSLPGLSPTGSVPSSMLPTISSMSTTGSRGTQTGQGLRTRAVSFALTSFDSQDTAKAQDIHVVPPSCMTTTKFESEIAWKVAAAIGWVVSLVLLSVVIVLIWLRHKDKKKYAVLQSQSQKNDEGLVYNPAYTSLSLSPKPVAGNVMNSGEYEEVDQLQ